VDERQHPRARLAALGHEACGAAPDREKRVLYRILGERVVAQDPAGKPVGDASEAVVELGQRDLVGASAERDDRLVREVRERTRHARIQHLTLIRGKARTGSAPRANKGRPVPADQEVLRWKAKYPAGAFGSRKSIGMLGEALETAFVGAYMDAVTSLQSNELKAVAAEIGACESRHLSVLTNIAAGAIVPAPDLPKGLTAKQATAAVAPFLA